MDADIEAPTKCQTWEVFGENDEEYWRRMKAEIEALTKRLERENSRRQQAITLLHERNLRPAHQNHDIGDAIARENTEAQTMSQFQPQTVLETPRQVQFGRNQAQAMSQFQPQTVLETPQQVQFGRNRTVVIDDSLTTNRATRLPMPILQTPVETPVPRTTAIEHEDQQVIPEQALTGRRTIRQRTPTVRQDPDDFLDENASQRKINEVAMMADNHQVVLSSSDTVKSKFFFEKAASEYHWSSTCEEVNIWMVDTQSRGSVTRSSSGALNTSKSLRVN
jgi:hypothetical protein